MQKQPFIFTLVAVIFTLGFTACGTTDSGSPEEVDAPAPPRIVFLTGDEEYRSEESMPMLARIAKRELGAEVSIVYAVDSNGIVDPNRNNHLVGLESLDSADLAVFFLRWRELPADQAKRITDYAESGRPMVGFRTATHTFLYRTDSSMMHLNDDWPTRVFGQQWITHHGHFDDGHDPMTSVTLVEEKADHPVLRGVTPFDAFSWLYHVDGGEWELYGDSDPLLTGRSLRSKHEMEGRLDQFPLTNPVAWTKSYTGTSGESARVFFTTLGHPFDFKEASMRKLALNGIYWALGREEEIPADGVDATLVGTYDPNNSGFGDKYKPGLKPEQVK